MKLLSHSPASASLPNASLMPKIWLDGRNVGRLNGTGVYHYALSHHSILNEINFQTAWLLENTEAAPPLSCISRLFRSLLSRSPNIGESFDSEWGKSLLAHDLYRIAHIHYRYYGRILKIRPHSPPDIMHWTYPLPILMEGCKNIVTIHDLIPLTHPELTRINPTRFHKLITNLIDSSVYFITVSETVRQQMLNIFSLREHQIKTLYQPIEFDNHIKENIEKAPQIAPSNSFIFYGRVEHRKNIERLLTAHALSRTETPLVIIGPDGDDKPNCAPRDHTSKVIRLPWSDRLSLLRALKEAKALVFPSMAEGFGLPIIEAMSLGVPVLTSRGGATEEIAGQAALLCNPTDTMELAKSIKQLDTLSPLDRMHLISKGKERAKFFSREMYKKRLNSFNEYKINGRI